MRPTPSGCGGPTVTTTGREPFVLDGLYQASAEAIKEAVTTAQPAQLVIASTKLINDPSNPMSKTDDFNKDIRDPVIFDPTLTIAGSSRSARPARRSGRS